MYYFANNRKEFKKILASKDVIIDPGIGFCKDDPNKNYLDITDLSSIPTLFFSNQWLSIKEINDLSEP